MSEGKAREAAEEQELRAEHGKLSSLTLYCVILRRLQLFTENTITVVLPFIAQPTRNGLCYTARVWGIVLAANLCGTFFIAAIVIHGTILPADILAALCYHISPVLVGNILGGTGLFAMLAYGQVREEM
jgi:formate/nitrite transporter FocA (FNT family)